MKKSLLYKLGIAGLFLIGFTLLGSAQTITLTYPIGGEKMYEGQPATITWTSTGITNVFIEVWAPDDPGLPWSWISFVASTPASTGKVDINVPADAPYGTEYKIRLSDLSNPAVNSTGGSFTIIGVATTLTDLRTRFGLNDIVKYTGSATVTYSRSNTYFNQKYIQDATAAMLIHDPSGFITGTFNVGDGITNVEGKITNYSGLIELVPQAATGEHATGAVIVPPVVDITALTAADQCKLVKIQKLKFANPTQYDVNGLYIANKNYDLTGLLNTSYAYRTNFAESDYIGTAVPTQYFDAVVLVGQFNLQMQVTARSSADITLLSDAKAITSFAFNGLTPAVTGTIDESGKTISLTVPAGTDLSSLVPTIAVSAKATVSPVSGVANNFTSPSVYAVTAEDGTAVNYTVTVSVATAINENFERSLTIFPVPVSSELTARNIQNVKSIEILDVTGKVVMTIESDNLNEIKIPVSNLTRGLYFIKFITGKGKVIKRFIKS